MSMRARTTIAVRDVALVALGALAVTLAVYWPALGYYLANDDFGWLANGRDFSWTRLVSMTGRDHFYRPLVEIYFASLLRVCGMNAACLHGFSLLLHAINIFLVWRLARAWIPGPAAPVLAALVFAVMPVHSEPVMWVAAVTELLPTLFSLATVLAFLKFLRGGGPPAYVGSIVAFVCALAVHESTVMVVPILMLCAAMERPGRTRESAVLFVPFLALLAGYLWIEYLINMKSYLIREGHYRFGLHAIPNIAQYLVLFYVGRRGLSWLVLNCAALVAALIFGRRDIRFAAAWILLTLLPFSFFTWGVSLRYAYLPAVGFALLVAAVLRLAYEWMHPRWRRTAASVVTIVAVAFVLRFAAFARKSVVEYAVPGTAYARYLSDIRRLHPQPARDATITVPAPRDRWIEPPYIEEMLRLEYGNPGLKVVFEEP
jgi:hypothetical protein